MVEKGSSAQENPRAAEEARAARLAAKIAAGEEAARKDRTRMLGWEKSAELLGSVSPPAVGQFLTTLPVEAIATVLRQMPELYEVLADWSTQYFDSLRRPDIEKDVQRLSSLGVRRETIALAMRLIEFSPSFDNAFAQLGDKREREQRAKRLLAPLPELDQLAQLFGEVPSFAYQEMPNPCKIISELKILSSILSWGEIVYDSLGANHLLEVSKFGLASLVHETTGKYLDREVGNLADAALKRAFYDETIYRVWRINNYKRLQGSVPIVTRLLVALNSVS